MINHGEHPGFYDKWYKIWSECSKEVLEATALIRVMECTNGCVQYGYRSESPNALSIEQTRECMRVSMGAIKSKVLPLPNGEIHFQQVLYTCGLLHKLACCAKTRHSHLL